MSELISEQAVEKQKRVAIETFIGSFMPSAKMMGLYQAGHPTIMQIAERLTNILIKTLGQETTLVVDVKGKTILIGEAALTETKDISHFASTMHTLGIGQVLFTNRLAKEGMHEFLKILLLRPDEKNTLTMIQQELQKTRIDGMQMSFVLSFVATGETTEAAQKPGELSEEQVQAFTQAETLPDFLLFLLKQSEPLSGKEAESLTNLLDNTLNRDLSLEQFQNAMPWSYYDPRIRARWDEFLLKQNWKPKVRGPGAEGDNHRDRQKWDKSSVISEIALFGNGDLNAIQDRHTHEKSTAVHHCLNEVVAALLNPPAGEQSSVALTAYGRLLTEVGQDGNIKTLLVEFQRWQSPLPSGEPQPQFATMVDLLEKKVLSPILTENVVQYMTLLEEKTEAFAELENFVFYLGIAALPLFIEGLRNLPDQKSRRKLCTLLGNVSKRLGDIKPLTDALKDMDWFVVRNIVVILGEINFPGVAKAMAPCLGHQHAKVREEVVRTMGRIGDENCVSALGSFILKGEKIDEVSIAISTISQLTQPGVDKRLIEAFQKTGHSELRMGIVTALSRVATRESEKFLETIAKRSFVEVFTGRNKALSRLAGESLEQVRKMLKG